MRSEEVELAEMVCLKCGNRVGAGIWEDFNKEYYGGRCDKCGASDWKEILLIYLCENCGHKFSEPAIIDEIFGDGCPECFRQRIRLVPKNKE
jgi:DNA-directed RNA polymerase subunit RPC12/RpoP